MNEKYEQAVLMNAQQKLEAIRKTPLQSKGLTNEEADIAARAGLIDPDQRWWWTEEWQKGEREAEWEIRKGKTEGPFSSADELIAHLHKTVRDMKHKP